MWQFEWFKDMEEPSISDLAFKWLVILIIILFFGAVGWLAAEASPFPDGENLKSGFQEPSLDRLQNWEPTRDRNVILKFRGRSFKHEILSVPTPVPQCGGVQVKGRELWLLTQELNPVLYIIAKEPNAWQKPGEVDWTGLTEKTFFPID